MREGGKEEEEEVGGRNSGRVKEGQKTGKAERESREKSLPRFTSLTVWIQWSENVTI